MSAAPGRSGEKAGEVEGRGEKRGRWDQQERPQGRYVVLPATHLCFWGGGKGVEEL